MIYLPEVADSRRERADRPALENQEIEITPEMIEAALPHLYRYYPESGVSDEDTVAAIYRAMRYRARRPIYR